MNKIRMLVRLGAVFVFLGGLEAGAFAQAGNIVTVPVTYTAHLQKTTGAATNPQFSVQFAGDSTMYYSNQDIVDTAPRTTRLEVGRRYVITMTGIGTQYHSSCNCYYPDLMSFGFSLNLSTTSDYVVYIEGIRQGYSGSGYGTTTLAIAVGPAGGCAACGPGSDYDVETDETRLAWTVKLGRSSEGNVIDPLKLSTDVVTNVTFTRDELNFAPRTVDVERIPAVGTLRQILLPGALLDVIDISGGFDLKFYSRNFVTSKNGAGEWQLQAGATPYVTYRWLSGQPGSGSPTSATFTRTATTTEQTYLQRNVTTGRWTKNEPAYGYEETVKVSDTVEDTFWKDSGGVIKRSVRRTYAEPLVGQREVVQEVDGANRTSSWVYYGDTLYSGSSGKLNWRQGPEGNYTVYTYWNSAGPAVGRVARVYTPYKDTPTNPSSSEAVLQSGRWSEYFWASDINGVGNLLSSRIDRVGPSTTVGMVTGTHDSSASANGKYLLSSVYRTYSSATAYVENTHKEYAASSATDRLYHGRAYADIAADGTQVSYVQQRGTWGGGTFTPNTTGTAWREAVIRGSSTAKAGTNQLTTYVSQTIQPVWVLPERSTITIRILESGYPVREEIHVCLAGTTFEQVSRIDRAYTVLGDLKTETRFDPATGQLVTLYDSNWVNNRLDWERDAQGVKRTFQYDLRGRLWKVTTEGVSGGTNGFEHAQTTTYTYDAANQIAQVELRGGQNGTLSSSTDYDLGGRVIQTTAPGGRQTGYAYQFVAGSPSYWQVTTTFPGLATRTTRSFRDGRNYQVLGTAVSGTTTFDYTIGGGGNETTVVTVAASNGDAVSVTRESRVTNDWASRQTSRLGYNANTEALDATATATYDSAGRPKRLATSIGTPAVEFEYDPIAGWTRQALDLDNNSTIGLSSVDRISESDGHYTKAGSTWWLIEASGTYDEVGTSEYQQIVSVQTQITNLSGATLGCVKHVDLYGQVTTTTTTFDWAQKQLQTVVDAPAVTNNQTSTVRNGRVASVITAQGLTVNFKYDQFGRQLGRQDPRKGWTNREFVNGSNDVWREQNEADAAAARWTATYEYDNTGRVSTVKNAANKYARYAYNSRGMVEYQWGETVTPVRYEYDGFGARVKMHTYRAGSGWTGTVWPTGTTGTADTTRWVYFDKTGLLKEKRDAGYAGDSSRKVSYTYTADGLPSVRTWARGVTTTYAYNAARELESKSYSGGITPAVTGLSYNRRGQLTYVTDATGGRILYYDTYGFQWAEQLSEYFKGRVLYSQRDGYGRRTEFGIYAQPDWTNHPEFKQTYTPDPAKGRLASMSSWSGANGNGTWRDSAYTYQTNSNQVFQVNQAWAGYVHEQTLDPYRDAVASSKLKNSAGSYEAIKATYTRDLLGRIDGSSRDNSTATADYNPLFRGYLSNAELKVSPGGYTYNDRHEQQGETLQAFVGGIWQNVDLQGGNRLRTFGYDNAQNREWAAAGGVTYDDPTPTNLNQPDKYLGVNVTYDKDGNLTSDGTWSYAYDAENRLIQSAKAGVTLTYQYDYADRRVEQKSWYNTADPNAVVWKRYVYDGWNVVADLWRAPGQTWDLVVACTYVWGPDVSGTNGGAGGIGGLVAVNYNGRSFLPLQDGRGNIHGYLDTTTGKNAAAWDFSPFGETLYERGGVPGQSGTWDFSFRYQSKMQDTAGHLLYFGYRYYHPGLGRFINRDPIGEAGGINLHAYVGNSPGNGFDLLGLKPRLVRRLVGGHPEVSFDGTNSYLNNFNQYVTDFELHWVDDYEEVWEDDGTGPEELDSGSASNDVPRAPGGVDRQNEAPNNTRLSQAECETLSGILREANGTLANALRGLEALSEMYTAHGGELLDFYHFINANAITGAGVSMAQAAELYRLSGTVANEVVTNRGVVLHSPRGAPRFGPWINTNGRFWSGLRATGSVTAVIGIGAEYGLGIVDAIEGDYWGAAEHGFDGTVGVVGLVSSNPVTIGVSVAYLGGKGIGTSLGNRAARRRIEEQIPGAEFSVELMTKSVDELKTRYEKNCQ